MIFHSQPTVAQTIELAKKNNIDIEKGGIAKAIEQTLSPHPWYVQSALGISAWIAGLIFAIYITRILGVSNVVVGVLIGFSLYSIGFLVFRARPNSITWRQFSLASSLAGLLVTTFFVFRLFASPWLVGLMLLTTETLAFLLHADPVRRYIAISNGLPALMFILASMESALAYQLVAPLGLYAVHLFWSRQDWQFTIAPEILKPLKYGLPVALFIIIQGLVSNKISTPVKVWDITNILTVIILARICYLELLRHQKLSPLNIIASVALMASMAIITVDSPGILVSITIIFIGFKNANRLLTFGAILAFILFLTHFYFALQLDLISKSILLSIGGVIFMLAARILHSRLKLEGTS